MHTHTREKALAMLARAEREDLVEDRRIADDLRRIEGKLDALLILMGRQVDAPRSVLPRPTGTELLPRMTTKQHAALQMVLRGAGNPEIAERFGVSVNTAKVYVRGLFKKFDVNSRAGIVLQAKTPFDLAEGTDYVRMSGGLPKDWDAKYEAPDPFAHLYRHEGDET